MSEAETRCVRLVDRALPALQHLVGATSTDVLRVPVEAAGGTLLSARPVHVQYRPGSDVVVRYSADVEWNGAPARRETLAAASAIDGPLPGTVTVTADTHQGPVAVGVWRWPFDPILDGLGTAVTPAGIAEALGFDHRDISLEVVSYRPTERAVVRVSTTAGEVIAYVKVVPPGETTSIVARHAALIDAGVPAPEVVATETRLGLLVLEPLVGPTLRELIKSDADGWPDTAEFDRLADAFAGVDLGDATLPSRLTDGALHARMLAAVAPELGDRLETLATRFEQTTPPAPDTTIHGDLHEAQLVVDDGRIVGVLDIDDAARGAEVDDRANLIARLMFRSTLDPDRRDRLAAYATKLRTASIGRFDEATLNCHIAAALVGLATGPFRIQSPGWRSEVGALIDVAVASLPSMRELSATPHVGLTEGCA